METGSNIVNSCSIVYTELRESVLPHIYVVQTWVIMVRLAVDGKPEVQKYVRRMLSTKIYNLS